MISLFGPAYRSLNWESLHKKLSSTNKIEFEIVFCGPNSSAFSSQNFTHILSNVKPVQCCEIARRRCKYDLIMLMPDDLMPSNGFLDCMYEKYLSEDRNNIVGSRMDGLSYLSYKFFPILGIPNIAVSGLLNKKEVDEIGGYDRNFLAIHHDIDLYHRLFEKKGGRTVFCRDDVRVRESVGDDWLYSTFWKHDRSVLNELWCKSQQDVISNNEQSNFHPAIYKEKDLKVGVDGDLMVSKYRLKKVEPFSDDNITETSQGAIDSYWN